MSRKMALPAKPMLPSATALWRGVIARTIQDWLSMPLRPKLEAERYLFKNGADLSMQPENREYQSIIVNNQNKWKIVGKVLWWIANAPQSPNSP
jgi:hypothetical protein